MRILVTASTLPRWEGDSIPDFVLNQALCLKRRYPELEIDILAPHHPGSAGRETIDNVTIRRFRYFWPESLEKLVYPAIMPNIRRNRWLLLQIPFLFIAEFFAILRFCIRYRPDVIYSHWFVPQALVGGIAAWLLRIPHVFTSHSSDIQIMESVPKIGPALVRFIVRRLRACTVVSRRTMDKLRLFFPDPAEWAQVSAKVRVLPMGVNTSEIQRVSQGENLAVKVRLGLSGKQVVLFIGRLSEKKGVRYLLEAFSRVSADRNDLALRIMGSGELVDSLRERIKDLGLEDSVTMLGHLNGERKNQYLRCADVMVIPSVITADNDAEGLPVVLLEGLAAGKICIATDVSGADDILTDGDNGFLFPARDIDSLAALLQKSVSLAAETKERISRKARDRAMEFDSIAMAEAHFEHLFSPAALR